MSNIVAIVGRPNVGKSTFFNRMIGMRKAIVDDVSGVTRDRQYGLCIWNGRQFTIIDTGGFIGASADVFAVAIRAQVHIAIEQAAVLVFMVDAMTGITDLDMQVAKLLRKVAKPVLLVVNKVDNPNRRMEAQEFWSLGFKTLHFVSSVSGSGTGDLLDEVVKQLPQQPPEEENIPKFAIIGRPNAGKSSLVNALLGAERSIVTPIAGTTRDTVNAKYTKFGKEFLLIDTAGLRRKKNVKENLEFYSVMRAIRAIETADVCILMLDATQGVEAQDLNIFRLVLKNNKGLLILVNKWDLIASKKTNTARDMEVTIRKRISPFSDVPVLFVSVFNKQRIYRAIEVALEVYENRNRKISTSKLNHFLKDATERYMPPTYRGRPISIKYMTQLPTPYPAFVLFCNYPKEIKESYKQYLENRFREQFEFKGTPIRLLFRKK